MQTQPEDGEERQIFVAQQKLKQLNLIDITEEQDDIALYDEEKMKNEQDTSDNIYKFLFPKSREEENNDEYHRLPWFDVRVLDDGCVIGGTIPRKGQLQWFVTKLAQHKKVQVTPNPLKKRKVFVRYPWFVYTGIFPDNREIVVANLADNDQPQLILHIDGQIICFFGYDGRNMIEYLSRNDTGHF